MVNDAFEKYLGQVFDNRYRITKILGVGGMAVVFEAVDTLMHRAVAIKMLKDEIAADTAAVRRFINESKAVSMLSHPNTVAIYDVSVKEGLKYIVMEKVEGLTLKKYMTQKGSLPVNEALLYTQQILRALQHAHSKGIIHRDIKPQNVMLLKNGVIKVADFGIAKLPNAETLTATDKAIGTVFYISPEQASGKKIDQRSDLYSVGIMLYEMVTGELPFNADSPVSVALMQVNATPKRPREIMHSIPIGLEQIILTAMQKQPEKRFQTASQMEYHVSHIIENPNYVFKTKQFNLPAANQNRPPVRKTPSQKEIPQSSANTQSGMAQAGAVSPQKSKKVSVKTARPIKPSRMNEKASMFPIIIGVLAAFLIIAAISAVYVLSSLLGGESNTKTVTIPQFIGDIYSDEYGNRLEQEGYRLKINGVYSDEYPANTIIDQTPKKGEKRVITIGRPSCDLALTVSLGSEVITLPDFTLLDYREVEYKIINLGLVCATEDESSDLVPEGYVTRTLPSFDATLKKGDTVLVYISQGPNITMVRVPDFVGKDEVTVMRMITENGLLVGNVEREWSSKPAGTVIWQSIEEGTEVAQGATEISFRVSKGPNPAETTTKATTTRDTSTRPPATTTPSTGDTSAPNITPPYEETTGNPQDSTSTPPGTSAPVTTTPGTSNTETPPETSISSTITYPQSTTSGDYWWLS